MTRVCLFEPVTCRSIEVLSQNKELVVGSLVRTATYLLIHSILLCHSEFSLVHIAIPPQKNETCLFLLCYFSCNTLCYFSCNTLCYFSCNTLCHFSCPEVCCFSCPALCYIRHALCHFFYALHDATSLVLHYAASLPLHYTTLLALHYAASYESRGHGVEYSLYGGKATPFACKAINCSSAQSCCGFRPSYRVVW